MESVTPWLKVLQDSFIIILPLSSLLAYAGIFFISVTAKILSISKKRSSYDKLSRQLAFLGLILGWVLMIGGRIWLYYNQNDYEPGTFGNFIRELGWMLLSIGVLLSSIFYTLWKLLRNMPVLHLTIGMISAIQNCFALASILIAARISQALENPEKMPLESIFPADWTEPVWIALIITIPLIFGMAAAFSLCWLPVMRRKDDFGRDYYNRMTEWLGGWARNSWAVIWIIMLISGCTVLLKTWPDINAIILECSSLLLWLLPVLLWTIVIKSKIPMRYTWINCIALALTICLTLPYYLEITLSDPGLDNIILNMQQ